MTMAMMTSPRPRKTRSTTKSVVMLSGLVFFMTVLGWNDNVATAFTVPLPMVHFTIGAIAGGAGAFAYYPLDYIKSQLQSKKMNAVSAADVPQERLNGWDVFVATVRENPLHLYKGVGFLVVGSAPEKSIKLGTNDILLDFYRQVMATTALGAAATAANPVVIPMLYQVLAGCIAGAFQVLVSSPMEVVKLGYQTSTHNKTSFAQVWQDTVGGDWKGLYRGADACMIRDVVFTGICLPLYTFLIHECHIDPFVAGAMSGVVSTTVATPPDMIKTRIVVTLNNKGDKKQGEQEQQYAPVVKNDKDFGVLLHLQESSTTSGSVRGMAAGAAAAVMPAMMSNSTFATASPYQMQSSGGLDAAMTLYNDVGTSQVTAALFQEPLHAAFVTPPTPSTEDSVPTTPQSGSNDAAQTQSINPFQVAKTIVKTEGWPVLFTGVKERAIGAIPRFGVTLGMHDYLEHLAKAYHLMS